MLKGIDINSNNWVSDWNKVKNAGIQVTINKATEGTYYKDKYLSYRVGECKRLGIKIGVYHFAGHQDVESEVNALIEYTKQYKFDTIFWLDIEQPPESYSWKWSGNEPANFVNGFIKLFKQKTGKEIGVYTNKYFYETFLKGKIDPNIKLWIASYGVDNNPYPQYSWQYSETGTVTGIDGNVDMDLFTEDILINTTSQSAEKAQAPKYDTSIPPESDVIKHLLENFYFEKRTDGNLGIHIDRGNYVVIGKGFIDLYWNDNKGNSGHKRIVG